jgi:hypothetical protein
MKRENKKGIEGEKRRWMNSQEEKSTHIFLQTNLEKQKESAVSVSFDGGGSVKYGSDRSNEQRSILRELDGENGRIHPHPYEMACIYMRERGREEERERERERERKRGGK